jgi:outer membrane protein insertion porin family
LGFSKIDEIFGSFELTERNFNAKGLFTLFSKGSSGLRGAGEYAHAKATIGQKERSYLITWMDPYFLDSLWRIGFEGSKTYSKLESKDYKTITYGFSFFTSYPLSNFWTFGSKYRLRHSETKLKHSIESKEDKDIEDNHGLISAIGSSISYDSTDRAYKAHRGLRSSLSAEFSGLGGDFYFFKFHYLNSLFIPVWEKGTLKLTANLKFLKPVGKTGRDDLPLSEKYFLGGEKSVRGYKPFILGPRRPGNSDDPIGGVSSTFLSCEYLQAIIPRLDAFVFFDSGSISSKQFSIPKLNSSYGVGIRLELMNRTPMIIGYGIPINPDHKGDKRKFFFSMGGQF